MFCFSENVCFSFISVLFQMSPLFKTALYGPHALCAYTAVVYQAPAAVDNGTK